MKGAYVFPQDAFGTTDWMIFMIDFSEGDSLGKLCIILYCCYNMMWLSFFFTKWLTWDHVT